jgi:hypothetical protein
MEPHRMKSEMFGYSNIPPTPVEKKNSNFMGGYGGGLQYRNDTRNTNSTIPSHTNDDYRNYFIGYHNGYEYMGDYIAKNGGTAPYICPSASQHSKEYCKGFIQGEAIGGWEEFDA